MEKLLFLLPEHPQPLLVRYGVSVAIMLVSAAIQLAVREYSGFSGYFLLIPGIFASGIIFDRGSGFVATFVGVLVASYLTTPSPLTNWQSALPLFLFVLVGLGVAAFSEATRKALQRAVQAEKAKDLVLKELGHRTKNNMTSIISILHFQSRSMTNPEAKEAMQSTALRVSAMADVHDHLQVSGASVDMAAYLGELCRKLGDTLRGVWPVAVKVHADPIELPSSVAVPLAIIANELITNSFKYAFPDDRAGTVTVTLAKDAENDQLELRVEDNGVGPSEGSRDGLGSRLVQLMAQQLGGTASRKAAHPGCVAAFRMPA